MIRYIKKTFRTIDTFLIYTSPVSWRYYGLHLVIATGIFSFIIFLSEFVFYDKYDSLFVTQPSFTAVTFLFVSILVGNILIVAQLRTKILCSRWKLFRAFTSYQIFAWIMWFFTIGISYLGNSLISSKYEEIIMSDLMIQDINDVFDDDFEYFLINGFKEQEAYFKSVLPKYGVVDLRLDEDSFGNYILLSGRNFEVTELLRSYVSKRVMLGDYEYYIGKSTIPKINFILFLLIFAPYMYVIVSTMDLYSQSSGDRFFSGIITLVGVAVILISAFQKDGMNFELAKYLMFIFPVAIYFSLVVKKDGIYIDKFILLTLVSLFFSVSLSIVNNYFIELPGSNYFRLILFATINVIIFLLISRPFSIVLGNGGIEASVKVAPNTIFNKVVLFKEK